jgi:hypothetical protein
MDGAELRERIDRLGLSYTEAAKRLGLSLAGLNHQMRGVHRVSQQTQIILMMLERLPSLNALGHEVAERRWRSRGSSSRSGGNKRLD